MHRKEFDEMLTSLRERGSELDDVEVKEASGGIPTRLWESISALANRAKGGTMIFGLSATNFEWIGVDSIDGLQRAVSNACSEMNPPVRPRMTSFTDRKKSVLVVEIPECPREHRPCHNRQSGLPGGAFIRVGDGDRRMTDYEVQRLIAERGQPKEDVRVVKEATIGDLNSLAITQYFDKLRQKNPDAKHLRGSITELSRRFSIIGEDDEGVMRPTLCGLLMFADYPQQFYPSLCITILRYAGPRDGASRGDDSIIENQKIEGPIPTMLEEAFSVIRRNMRKGTLKTGLLAEDLWEYPELALREVVVNAVAHRDYGPWAAGTQVQVKMYSDALIVQNPGGLFGPVSEDTLDEVNVIQAARNGFLMSLLERVGIVENRGSGIRTMIAQLARAGLPPPQFKDHGSHFRAIFLNETLLDPATIDWLSTLAPHPLNERQRRALAYLKRYKSIRNKDYCRLNNCDSRLSTAELSELRELSLINQSGTRGGAVYYLSPISRTATTNIPGGMKLRHAKLLACFRENPEATLSAKDITRRSGLNHETTRAALRDLVRSGHLLPTEEKARSSRQAYRLKSS